MPKFILPIPTELPVDELKTIAAYFAPGGEEPGIWAVHDAAIVAELYFTSSLRADATHPGGTLSLTQEHAPLTDEQAVAHLRQMAGEGPQAAIDPATKKLLLDWVTKTLLPMLLARLFGG